MTGASRKVLLVYAFERYWGKKPRLPLSHMVLAAGIRPEFEPVILDTRLETDLEGRLRVELQDTLCVGFSVMIGNQIRFSQATAQLIRSIAPDVPIIFGGTFPSMAPELTVADPNVDMVVRGSSIRVFRDLLRSLRDGHDPRGVPGVVVAPGPGPGRTTAALPNAGGDLRVRVAGVPQATGGPGDSPMPTLPAWDLVDPGKYKQFDVVASAGCRFRCTYCYVEQFHGSAWWGRPPEAVVEEIQFLTDRYRAREFQFVDDNFFDDKDHARELLDAILRRDLRIRWESTCRADDFQRFSPTDLQLIRQSGCVEVFVGAESGSRDTLKRVRKGLLPDSIAVACERAAMNDIRIKLLWMIGLVDETPVDRRATFELIDLVKKKWPNHVKISSFGIYTPYPGLTLTDRVCRDKGQVLPDTLDGWGAYFHDNCNHTWRDRPERQELESLMWIQRYAHAKNRPKGGVRRLIDTLLRIDAQFRWRTRWFSHTWEWGLVRSEYDRFVRQQLDEIRPQPSC